MYSYNMVRHLQQSALTAHATISIYYHWTNLVKLPILCRPDWCSFRQMASFHMCFDHVLHNSQSLISSLLMLLFVNRATWILRAFCNVNGRGGGYWIFLFFFFFCHFWKWQIIMCHGTSGLIIANVLTSASWDSPVAVLAYFSQIS